MTIHVKSSAKSEAIPETVKPISFKYPLGNGVYGMKVIRNNAGTEVLWNLKSKRWELIDRKNKKK